MGKYEEIQKLTKTGRLFKGLKFIGLAALIIGGVILVFSSSDYLLKFMRAMQSGNQSSLLNAVQTYFKNLLTAIALIVPGIVVLTVFHKLGNKNLAKAKALEAELAKEEAENQ